MAYQDIVNALARRQDSFLDGLDQLLNPRQQTKGVVTVVAVTTIVAPKTFEGSAVYVTATGDAIAGGAVFASRTTDTADSVTEAAAAATTTTTTTEAASSSTPVSQPTSQAAIVSTPVYSTPAAASSTLSGAAKSPEVQSSNNTGMSGGAKAGIAFGVLIPLAALLIGALIFLRRKKQQQAAGERLDDEKAPVSRPDALPSFPAPGSALAPQMAARSQQDSLAAPQLQLRPESKFDPRMSKLGSNGSAMAAGAFGAAAVTHRSPSSNSTNAWDRPGAEKHANNPANPFGNHAETVNNPQAAVASQPRAPSPSHIEASDFPLPISVAPSEKAISLRAEPSSDNLSMAPSNPATASLLSLAPQNAQNDMSTGQMAGMAAGAAAIGGAALAAGAANKRNSPPPGDNVFRVQLDFKPSMEDELEIRAGQLVRCLHEYDDGWALCSRMDRSQQGVVPRTCLSKNVVKPRPNNASPPQGRPGQAPGAGMRGPPNGPPRAMTPNGGRNSPAPYAQSPRPLSPAPGRNSPAPGRNSPAPGRNSPAPFAQQPRPMSPAGPQNRARAQSNAPAFGQYNPQQRSQSPGPYGPPGQFRPPPSLDQASRMRSNSMSNLAQGSAPIKPLSPTGQSAQILSRKPVPGQAV